MMKKLAWLVTVLTHPLIVMNFALFTVFRFHPYFLSKFYEDQFYTISMFIAVNTLVMPLLSVYLLKRFNFISDFSISNPKQRLLPYGILVLLLVFTMYQLYKIDLSGIPLVFMGASALCVLLNILINTRFMISSHAIGAGGWIALYVFLSLFRHISGFNGLLIVSILVSGAALWSRLYLNAHTEKQVYTGLVLGFCVVLAATLILA